MRDRWRGDAEVYFGCAGVAHHLHDLARGGAAHDRVVDQHDALAGHHGAIGRMFHAYAMVTDRLGRLDEGAPDVVISDDAVLEGNPGLPGIADPGWNAGIG